MTVIYRLSKVLMRIYFNSFFFFKCISGTKTQTFCTFFFKFHSRLDKTTQKIYIYKLYHMVGGWLLLLCEEVEAFDIDFGLA